MTRWLVRLYPRAWRRRYEAEFVALLEGQALTPAVALDVIRGALDAQRTVRLRRGAPAWRTAPAEPARERGKGRNMKQERGKYVCSFCGKHQDAVRRLIAGPGGVYICDECVALCNEIITNEEQRPPAPRGEVKRRRESRRKGVWRRLRCGWRRLVWAPVQDPA